MPVTSSIPLSLYLSSSGSHQILLLSSKFIPAVFFLHTFFKIYIQEVKEIICYLSLFSSFHVIITPSLYHFVPKTTSSFFTVVQYSVKNIFHKFLFFCWRTLQQWFHSLTKQNNLYPLVLSSFFNCSNLVFLFVLLLEDQKYYL